MKASIGLLAVVLAHSVGAAAQQPRVENLEPAATFEEPFSAPGGLRWLGNGDMLVSDRTEKSVYLINFETGAYEMLGRNGRGPGEYDMPTGIFPFSDGRAAIIDMGNTRVALMNPDGSIDNTFPIMVDNTFRMPMAGDETGKLYTSSQNMVTLSSSGPAPRTTPSEATITRWDPTTEVSEEIGTIAIPRRDLAGSGVTISGGQISGMPVPRPFRPQDAWAVSREGRVAVARAEPYHVEWLETDGSVVSGPEVAYEPIRIGNADKEAWADEQSQQSATISMSTTGGGGGGTRSFQMPRPDVDEVEFPEHFPAFKPRGAAVSYEGDLWLERYERYSADRVLFDVFDSDGNLARRVALPKGRSVVGFGPETLYATWSDEDDLQWLEAYDLGR